MVSSTPHGPYARSALIPFLTILESFVRPLPRFDVYFWLSNDRLGRLPWDLAPRTFACLIVGYHH